MTVPLSAAWMGVPYAHADVDAGVKLAVARGSDGCASRRANVTGPLTGHVMLPVPTPLPEDPVMTPESALLSASSWFSCCSRSARSFSTAESLVFFCLRTAKEAAFCAAWAARRAASWSLCAWRSLTALWTPLSFSAMVFFWRGHLVARRLQPADQVVVAADEIAHDAHAAHEILEARGGQHDVDVGEVVGLVGDHDARLEVVLLEGELPLRGLQLEPLEAQLLLEDLELVARGRELLLDHAYLVAETSELVVDGRELAVERGDLVVQRRLVLLGGGDLVAGARQLARGRRAGERRRETEDYRRQSGGENESAEGAHGSQ